MDNVILSIASLNIGYTARATTNLIAKDINLNLQQGKLIALIGANGIGKSTLLRTITGLQQPLSGSVLLDGNTIDSYSPLELAKKLSIVLTEKLPPSNLSVFELVALGRQPYTNWIGKLTEEDRVKINEAISLTQIAPLLEKKHYEISDGQLQKVLIARALSQDTPLIILDEPTTHLDLLHKVTLFRLLKQLTLQTNKCILFSTHDIDLAIQLSDEMIVMTTENTVQGKPEQLIADGTFDKLFKDESIVFDKEKGKFVFIPYL